MTKRLTMIVVTYVFLSGLSLPAQDKPAAPVSEADEVKLAREQLQLSRDQVALLRIQHAESKAEIERVEHPVLRFTAPLWGGHHGTVWIWGKRGRPVAVLEMFRQPDGLVWNQAFHSTSDVPIKLTAANGATWTPQANSLKIQRLPDAPTPAEAGRCSSRIREPKTFERTLSFAECVQRESRPESAHPAAVESSGCWLAASKSHRWPRSI